MTSLAVGGMGEKFDPKHFDGNFLFLFTLARISGSFDRFSVSRKTEWKIFRFNFASL